MKTDLPMPPLGFSRTIPGVLLKDPAPGSRMFDVGDLDKIAWTETPLLPGLKTKIVYANIQKGVSVMLLSIAPGVQFPVHTHYSASMLFLLKGRFAYMPAGSIGPGGFGYEPNGVVHEPDATGDEETQMWVINFDNAVTQFYNADGSPGAIVHLAESIKQARRDFGWEAVSHLDMPDDFWDEA